MGFLFRPKPKPPIEPPIPPVPPDPPKPPDPPPVVYPARLYRHPDVLGGRNLCRMGTATPEVMFGVSAFSACHLVFHGQQGELERYLDWMRENRLTYGRVFLSARNMFDLHPQDGLNMLPVVLDLFGRRGLYCEVVAIADTGTREGYDWTAHVHQAGVTCSQFSNSLIEVCNEPAQPWQRFSVQQLAEMAAWIPAEVPVSLGAADGGNDESTEFISSRSTYATVHGDRNGGAYGWRPCRHTKEQLHISEKTKLMAWNDERFREMHDPARHFAVSAVERVCHLGGLFHSEGGKYCRIPDGDELPCWQQTRRAWDFLPVGFFGTFANVGWRHPLPESAVDSFTAIDNDPDARCYATGNGAEQYVAVIRAQPIWRSGWRVVESIDAGPNASFVHVVR